MTIITEEQFDLIHNALLVGMAKDDAYVFAGLTPAQIASVSEDEEIQSKLASITKQHEYMLLDKLNKVIEKQSLVGEHHAIAWSLEHIYPQRYANKSTGDGRTVNIVIDGKKDPAADTEVVELHT